MATETAQQREPLGRTGGVPSGLVGVGRRAWALVGILALVAAALYATQRLMLLVAPLVLALFPAALLEPVSRWLKDHKVPPSLASLLTIIASIALIAGVIAALVPVVRAELPELIEAGEQGIEQLQGFLEDDPLGLGIGGLDQLLQQAQELVGQAGEYAGQALEALITVVEGVTATIFLLVALFFYLKDDRRLARGFGDLLPQRVRGDATAMASRVWNTLGSFFRGQLLIALVDAIFIGLGLVILQVPLALPLAVLIFFGGLFPIVGAFATGTLAVLVGLADGGLLTGLIVLGIVVGVQQLEGNVLEPLVLGRAIRLHPLLVIVAVAGGGILIGILGAFLAVPIVASVARVIEYLRERGAMPESELEAGTQPDDAAGQHQAPAMAGEVGRAEGDGALTERALPAPVGAQSEAGAAEGSREADGGTNGGRMLRLRALARRAAPNRGAK